MRKSVWCGKNNTVDDKIKRVAKESQGYQKENKAQKKRKAFERRTIKKITRLSKEEQSYRNKSNVFKKRARLLKEEKSYQ